MRASASSASRLSNRWNTCAPPGHRAISARLPAAIHLGPRKRVSSISASRVPTDSSAGGIQTDDLDIEPNMRRLGDVWLVLERMYAHSQVPDEKFGVELFVDQPGAVEWGAWRATDD